MKVTRIFNSLTVKAKLIAGFGTVLIAIVIVAVPGAVEFTFGF